MELDSDGSEEGGVRVDDYLEVSLADTGAGDADVKARYHQNPNDVYTRSEEGLWQLPVEPLTGRKSRLYRYYGLRHTLELAYHHNCKLIRGHWSCDNPEFLPPTLARTTPYSFAMLIALRRLAPLTKSTSPHTAHEMLEQQVASRLSERVYAEATIQTFPSSIIPKPDMRFNGEESVIERVDGLTIEDVVVVANAARQGRNRNRVADRAQQAERVVQQRRAERGKLRETRFVQEDEITVDVQETAKSRTAAKGKLTAQHKLHDARQREAAQAWQLRPTNSEMVSVVQDATADADPLFAGGKNRYAQDRKLSRLARKMFSAESGERRNKKAAHRNASSLARRRLNTSSLPSERFNFATLPALSAMPASHGESSDEQANAANNQRPLPGGVPLSLPIRTLPSSTS